MIVHVAGMHGTGWILGYTHARHSAFTGTFLILKINLPTVIGRTIGVSSIRTARLIYSTDCYRYDRPYQGNKLSALSAGK